MLLTRKTGWMYSSFMQKTLTFRQARRARNLKPREIAKLAQISLSQVYRLDDGDCIPLADTADRIEMVLGARIKWKRAVA